MKTDREYRPLMCMAELHNETRSVKDAHPLVRVVHVRLVRSRKVQPFLAGSESLWQGDNVVVETERGTAHGLVVTSPALERTGARTLRRVLRRLDGEAARKGFRPDPEREKQAHRMGKQLIRDMRLDMKVVEVEFVPWENRIVFHFVAEERVDFRDLVKELSRLLRCRIEMRQIGPRDETKMLGGIGRCGQEHCCSRHLNEFMSVRTKMAKERGLVVNQEKITGHCRKLLCCLGYERDMYNDMKSTLPPVGTRFETPGGMARVSEQLVLRQQVRICLEETRVFKDVDLAELTLNEDNQWALAKVTIREGDDFEGEHEDNPDETDTPRRSGDGRPGQPRHGQERSDGGSVGRNPAGEEPGTPGAAHPGDRMPDDEPHPVQDPLSRHPRVMAPHPTERKAGNPAVVGLGDTGVGLPAEEARAEEPRDPAFRWTPARVWSHGQPCSPSASSLRR